MLEQSSLGREQFSSYIEIGKVKVQLCIRMHSLVAAKRLHNKVTLKGLCEIPAGMDISCDLIGVKSDRRSKGFNLLLLHSKGKRLNRLEATHGLD